MVEQPAHCNVCDRVTTHRRDNAGALHCVPCVLESSFLPSSDVTPDQTPVVPMVEEPTRRRSTGEMIAAVVTVAIVGFLVYAFIRGV